MADRIKQAPKDLATEAVIKFIFGEAVSKVAGRLSLVVDAITPRMAADGTITGQVEGWKQRCETFLVQEVKREAYARYLLDQQRIIQYRLRTEQLPQYQYNMLLNAAYQANAIADNEFRTLRSNVPATVWCNNFLPKAKAFLNPKKTSSDDTDRVILP